MTSREAAEALGTDQRRINKYCERGHLRAAKNELGYWAIDPDSVRDFVKPKRGAPKGHKHGGRPLGAKDKKPRKVRSDKGVAKAKGQK